MNKRRIIFIVALLVTIGIWVGKKFFSQHKMDGKTTLADLDTTSYYTCPMHPQVHMDKPGQCPICHMELVKVTKQENVKQSESRATLTVTPSQLAFIGVQKRKVEKMNLTVEVPVSGRFTSGSVVAFQIYERDLALVHSGLKFRGRSAIKPDHDLEGVITSVDAIVDPSSRTVRVVGSLRGSPGQVGPESSFRGAIEAELKDRIAIPEEAVLHTGNGDLVYLFGENDRLSAKPVKLGAKANGYYEIKEGLSENDLISSGANFLLDSEAKIRGTND